MMPFFQKQKSTLCYSMQVLALGGFLALSFSFFGFSQNANTTTHTVQEGETLYRIAARYQLSVQMLKDLNPTVVGTNISIGDVLSVPVASAKPSVAAKKNANTKASVSAKTSDIKNDLEVKLSNLGLQTTPAKNPEQLLKDNKDAAKPLPTAVPKTAAKPTLAVVDSASVVPLKHVIQAKETLFGLSKSYKQSIEDIIKWNNLQDRGLVAGRELIVGWSLSSLPTAAIPVADKAKSELVLVKDIPADTTAAVVNLSEPKRKLSIFERTFQTQADDQAKFTRKKTNGIAITFDDGGAKNSGELYVLHKTAPLRSIIKITNPVNRHTAYAMVLGRPPVDKGNEKVMLSLPKSTANYLNIRDNRALVETIYYTPKK